MKDFFLWLKWFLYDIRVCEHTPGEWEYVNLGYSKLKPCKKCNKVLEMV